MCLCPSAYSHVHITQVTPVSHYKRSMKAIKAALGRERKREQVLDIEEYNCETPQWSTEQILIFI